MMLSNGYDETGSSNLQLGVLDQTTIPKRCESHPLSYNPATLQLWRQPLRLSLFPIVKAVGIDPNRGGVNGQGWGDGWPTRLEATYHSPGRTFHGYLFSLSLSSFGKGPGRWL